MSTDTQILSQTMNDTKIVNDKNDNNNKNTSCTPRNALFCCSSPVCLKLSTAPKILPIDYHYQYTLDNINNINSNYLTVITNDSCVNGELIKNGEEIKMDTINIPLSVPDLAKMNAMTNTNGIIINGNVTTNNDENNHENENDNKEIMKKERRMRIKTPPAPSVKLGVALKKVTPPKTKITVKNHDAPMLGVVLRKVEKKVEPVKSILEDDKPLYHLTVVRNGDNSKSSGKTKTVTVDKHQQKNATSTNATKTTADATKTSSTTNSSSNNKTSKTSSSTVTNNQVNKKPTSSTALSKTQPRMPVTVQKIEGDKIIIIKKIPVPKNGKLPPHLLHLQVVFLTL